MWGFSLAAVAAACLWASPFASADTVLVGNPMTAGFPGAGTLGNNGSTQTVANITLMDAGAHVTSPVTGTITRWRISTIGTGEYALRVLRPTSGGLFLGAGRSPQNVTTSGPNTFNANLPIQAGDLIAVDLPDNQGMAAHQLINGAQWDQFTPAIAEGSSIGPDAGGTNFTTELDFNADVQYTPSSDSPPASPGTAKKCKKKKKHKRSALAAKKCGKKKGKK